MAHRYLGGILENAPEPSQAAPLRDLLLSLAPRVWADITEFRTHHALASIWEGVRRTNAFLEECAPWAKAKQGDRAGVAGILRAAAESIRIVSVLISPFLPSTVRAIRTQTNLPPAARWDEAETWSVLPPGHRVGEPKPIFPRVDIPSEED
jgi:methionyl-tRNA synthetase